MKQNNRTVYVDAMNLYYRCAYVPAFAGMINEKGTPIGVIYGFLQSILLYAKASDEIVIAWDTRSERKRRLYPDYKIKRTNDDPIAKLLQEAMFSQVPILKRMITLLGFTQYQIEGYEADETIGSLALHSDKYCVIISEDKDFLQLVNERIHIWQPIKKRIVTESNFAKFYDMEPKHYLTYRVWTGDQSDSITGVPGCGEKTGRDIALKKQTKLTEKLFKNQNVDIINEITKRNRELMQITKESVSKELLDNHKKTTDFSSRIAIYLDKFQFYKIKEILRERWEYEL